MRAEIAKNSEQLKSQALTALNNAALAISSDLELDHALQLIVESARELVSASYSALGIFNSEGELDTFLYSGLSSEEADEIGFFPEGLGLLGAVLKSQHPIRVADIGQDPHAQGIPQEHPTMTSFLGVPIITGETVQGNLYLTDKVGGDGFTDTDEELITVFASRTAVAIKNARLYEEVGRLAIIEERSRIGMDLHDGVIQSIYAVGLTLESAQMILEENPDQAHKLLNQGIAGLNDAIRDIRNFTLDLLPRRFEGDLNTGIARLVREFQANAMVEVDVTGEQELTDSISSAMSQAVFLTAQEALANIDRHARASRVGLDLSGDADSIWLRVADDGRGFDIRQKEQTVGHGLANMRARAEELGGSFKVDSELGKGTTIQLRLPLKQ